ncbi:MAG: hypothetical protein ABWX58_02760 [Psychrobacillus psychrotolerans]
MKFLTPISTTALTVILLSACSTSDDVNKTTNNSNEQISEVPLDKNLPQEDETNQTEQTMTQAEVYLFRNRTDLLILTCINQIIALFGKRKVQFIG